MIIEFAGLPGSGKSTAAAGLLTSLADAGASPIAAADLAVAGGTLKLGRCAAVARHSQFAGDVARLAWRSPRTARERWLLLRTVAVTLQRFDAARALVPARPVVFHEGIAQRSFLALVEAHGVGSQNDMARYLRHAPRPDVVILLRVDPSTCLDRLARRERGLPARLVGLSVHDVENRLDEADTMLARVVHGLDPTRDVTNVIQVDGEADDLQELVLQALEPLLGALESD